MEWFTVHKNDYRVDFTYAGCISWICSSIFMAFDFLPFIKIVQEKMNEHLLRTLILLLFSLEIVSGARI